MLKNLFKPKWQHTNPEVRKQALLTLKTPDSQQIFTSVAQSDAVPELRLLATRRLLDLPVLTALAQDDADMQVRKAAEKAVMQMLAGLHEHALPLSERLSAIENLTIKTIIDDLARKGREAEIRLAAIAKTDREALLGDVAIQDPDANLRQQAVNRIHQKSTLERVYKAAKTKDKHISQQCKERLDAIQAEEEKPQRLRDQRRKIVLTVEHLLHSKEWLRGKPQIDSLQSDWRDMEGEIEPEMALRFESAVHAFDAQYQQFEIQHQEMLALERRNAPIRAEKTSLLARVDAMLLQLKEMQTLDDELAQVQREQLSALQSAWTQLDALGDNEQRDFEKQFSGLSKDVEKIIADLTATHQASTRIRRLLNDAARWLASDKPFGAKKLDDFKAVWAQHNKFLSGETLVDLKTQYQSLLEKLLQEIKARDATREQVLVDLKTGLKNLEDAIVQGAVKLGQTHYKFTHDALIVLEQQNVQGLQKWRKQFQTLAKRLHELGDWRSWANTPKKEQLVLEVEAFIGSNDDPRDIANAINLAKQQWRDLGPAEREASKELWERFRDACDKAYAPCETFFAEQSAQMEASRVAREEFLVKLETFLSQVDWDNVDVVKLEALSNEAPKEWAALGLTDKKFKTKFNRRFYDALEKIRDHIKLHWTRSQASKQALIDRVNELLGAEDIADAIEQVKVLQASWKDAGRVSPKQERLLWSDFKKACNAVFERREQQREERKHELVQNQHAKEAILVKLTHWLAQNLDEIANIESELKQTLSDWNQIGFSGKACEPQLDRQFRALVSRFDGMEQALARREQVALLKRVRSQAPRYRDYLAALAARNSDAKAPDADDERAQNVDKALAENISSHFESIEALVAQLKSGNAVLTQIASETLDKKDDLVVRLEIMAGVDSPAEARTKRLQVQVNRLSEEMGKGEHQETWQDFLTLEQDWIFYDFIPQTRSAALDERHAKIVSALKKQFPVELKDY